MWEMHLSVRPLYAHVDIQESSLCHLEHEPHLGAHLDLVEEALLRVGIHLEQIEIGQFGKPGFIKVKSSQLFLTHSDKVRPALPEQDRQEDGQGSQGAAHGGESCTTWS